MSDAQSDSLRLADSLEQTNYSHDHSTGGVDPTTPPLVFPVTTRFDVVRDQLFHAALKHFKGNRTHAAKSLGISVRTFQRWQIEGLKTLTPLVK